MNYSRMRKDRSKEVEQRWTQTDISQQTQVESQPAGSRFQNQPGHVEREEVWRLLVLHQFRTQKHHSRFRSIILCRRLYFALLLVLQLCLFHVPQRLSHVKYFLGGRDTTGWDCSLRGTGSGDWSLDGRDADLNQQCCDCVYVVHIWNITMIFWIAFGNVGVVWFWRFFCWVSWVWEASVFRDE